MTYVTISAYETLTKDKIAMMVKAVNEILGEGYKAEILYNRVEIKKGVEDARRKK